MKNRVVLHLKGKPICEVGIDLNILANMTQAEVVRCITEAPISFELAEGDFVNACKFAGVILHRVNRNENPQVP